MTIRFNTAAAAVFGLFLALPSTGAFAQNVGEPVLKVAPSNASSNIGLDGKTGREQRIDDRRDRRDQRVQDRRDQQDQRIQKREDRRDTRQDNRDDRRDARLQNRIERLNARQARN